MADNNEPVCTVDHNKCIICQKDADGELKFVTKRDVPALINSCELCGLLTFKDYILASPQVVLVHNDCWRSFVDAHTKRLKVDDQDESDQNASFLCIRFFLEGQMFFFAVKLQ